MSDVQNAEATAQTPSMSDIASGVQEAGSAQQSAESGSQASVDNVEDFQKFVQEQQSTVQQLQEDLSNVKTEYQELNSERQREALNKDIANAVEIVNDGIDADPEMTEIFLEKQYAKNPDFKKIWENRHANPDAYKQALGLLQAEWGAKNNVTIDPQVAENQRALLQSQQSGQTVKTQTESERLESMPDAEFFSTFSRMARGS